MYDIFHAHTHSPRRVNWNHRSNNIFDFWQIITETFSCVIHRPISLLSTQSRHLVEMVFAESALVYDEHLFLSLRLISLNSHSNCFRKWNLNMSHSCRVCVCVWNGRYRSAAPRSTLCIHLSNSVLSPVGAGMATTCFAVDRFHWDACQFPTVSLCGSKSDVP